MNFDIQARLFVCEVLEVSADCITLVAVKLTDCARRVAKSRSRHARFQIAQERIRQRLDRRTSIKLRRRGAKDVQVR